MGGGIRRWTRSHEEAGTESGGTSCRGARGSYGHAWPGRGGAGLAGQPDPPWRPGLGRKSGPARRARRAAGLPSRMWRRSGNGPQGPSAMRPRPVARSAEGSGQPGPRRTTGARTHATAASSVYLMLIGPSGDCDSLCSAITLKFSLLEDY
jgi:hypothetical protein